MGALAAIMTGKAVASEVDRLTFAKALGTRLSPTQAEFARMIGWWLARHAGGFDGVMIARLERVSGPKVMSALKSVDRARDHDTEFRAAMEHALSALRAATRAAQLIEAL